MFETYIQQVVVIYNNSRVPALLNALYSSEHNTPGLWLGVLLFAALAYIFLTREGKYGREVTFWRKVYLGAQEAPVFHRHAPSVWAAVHHLRVVEGTVADNAANRLMISLLARKYLLNLPDMRERDVSGLFQEVVDIFFLKSERDEYLEKVRHSRAYRRMARTQLSH